MKTYTNETIFMSPNNGQLVVGVPLYQRHSYGADNNPAVRFIIEEEDPVAYAVDCGPTFEMFQFMNAEWVHKNLICLGEL